MVVEYATGEEDLAGELTTKTEQLLYLDTS